MGVQEEGMGVEEEFVLSSSFKHHHRGENQTETGWA